MKGIAVLSDKGGVGKSTLCHLLALGAAGWRGVPAYLFHTDNREPMKVNGRPYAYIDAREMDRLSTVMGSLVNNDGFCIIDGGGNRPEFDQWIAEAVDIVLIPVTADEEAVKLAKETMARLEGQGIKHARYILNMVSPNEKERLYDFRMFFSDLEEGKISGQIKRVSTVRRLRMSDDDGPFPTPPSNVNNLSRSLHHLVDDALDNMVEVDIELTGSQAIK
ncbi:MAG: ParA family protein [Candidatus Competibacteraceae bacterium]|nr:ParA family protein [Candidatus Competibacteraceae bacterium]